jgi:hypothetical protein
MLTYAALRYLRERPDRRSREARRIALAARKQERQAERRRAGRTR